MTIGEIVTPATAPRTVRSCLVCGSPLEALFVDLGMSPPCEDFLTADRLLQPETFYPLDVRVCGSCLLVQLPPYVTPDDVFREYAYFSSYSDSWVDHARRFVDRMVAELALGPHSRIVEVASNDGYLLQHVVAAGLPALGIEPAHNVAVEAGRKGIRTIEEFFGVALARQLRKTEGPADLIVANNVFAHIPDPNDFAAGLNILLASGGTLTIEVAYVARLIEGNQFDTIYHEHFMYWSLLSAETALARHGLRVFDVEELATHGGSLRFYVAHDDDPRPSRPSVAALRDRELSIGFGTLDGYRGFDRRVAAIKADLLEFLIGAARAGKRVAGYGAPGKGNTLLNYCGIRTDLIEFLVDRNPYKHGRYTPGTHIPIHAPAMLDERPPDYVVVMPWNLRTEIVPQLRATLPASTRFVVAIPQLEVFE
jgi:SAM-dependent methyltransferase